MISMIVYYLLFMIMFNFKCQDRRQKPTINKSDLNYHMAKVYLMFQKIINFITLNIILNIPIVTFFSLIISPELGDKIETSI